jgi:ATP-citrate lyase alpha-subunit
MSTISGERDDEVQLLGKGLLDTIESNSLASLTLAMLLGKPISSKRLIAFSDYVLRLLIDHGPYVSGALNTIITARAGKDLTSSLASGLLTIGPRFGGAINEAARCWLEGVETNQTAKECVHSFAARHEPIPGIGHKKYRIDLPDPRVAALRAYAASENDENRHLKFALSVQVITTAKKGNLILNVDGTIAAILLDLLETELGYDYKKLQELVNIGFFNAFFVISRTIGFTAHYLDQCRHDEGLVRFSEHEVAYIPSEEQA